MGIEKWPVLPVTYHFIDASTPEGKVIAEQNLALDRSATHRSLAIEASLLLIGLCVGGVLTLVSRNWAWLQYLGIIGGFWAFVTYAAWGPAYTSDVAVAWIQVPAEVAGLPTTTTELPIQHAVRWYFGRVRSRVRSGKLGSFRSFSRVESPTSTREVGEAIVTRFREQVSTPHRYSSRELHHLTRAREDRE